jgi:hypothetical protein
MLFKKRDKKKATKTPYNQGGMAMFQQQTEPRPKGKIPFKTGQPTSNTVNNDFPDIKSETPIKED